MTSIECILKKGAAYTRFRVAVLVMREVLAAAPDPVHAGELERVAGCSSGLLTRVCSNLAQAGMLSPAAGIRDAWLPGPLDESITLADILCSEIAYQTGKQKASPGPRSSPERRPHMDAFVLQATIDINQTVLAQLRRFPLHRAGGHAAAPLNA